MTDLTQLHRRLRLALQQDDLPEAIACLEEASALAQAAGDPASEGRYLGNLALLYHRIQRTHDALNCFARALPLVQAEGDRATEEGLLGNMGSILREVGQLDTAVDHLNRALLIAQEIGDARGRGIWLSNLGLTFNDLGQHDRALAFHQQSIDVARDLRDLRGQASRLAKLAATLVALGRHTDALKAYGDALSLYHQIDDTAGLLETLTSLGYLHRDLGLAAADARHAQVHFQRTYYYHQQALSMARQQQDPRQEADLLVSIGAELGNQGDYDRALACFREAEHIFQLLGLHERLPEIKQNIQTAISLRKNP